MSITLLDPWSDKREFLLGRRECEAIAEVDPAVAERKKLYSEQVLAAKCLEPQLLSHKYRADLLSPLWGQINRQRPWPVVEPVVLERFTALPNLRCEGPRGGCNGGRGFRGHDLAGFSRPSDDNQQVEGPGPAAKRFQRHAPAPPARAA